MDQTSFIKTIKTCSRRHTGWIFLSILVILTGVISYLSLSSMSLNSATDDEPAHIASGYIKLKFGYFDFYREQPPLINSLSTVPLLFLPLHINPVWETNKNHWGVGHDFLYRSQNDADQMLFYSRLPIVMMFLLLCWICYFWIYRITRNYGVSLMVFVLVGFCPNLIAHGTLATVDMGVTFFLTVATMFFFSFLYKPQWWNIILTGVMVAATALSKISGLIIIPYFGLVFLLFLFLERKKNLQTILLYIGQILLIGIVAFLTLETVFLVQMKDSYLTVAYPHINDLFGKLWIPVIEYWKEIETVQRWVQLPYDKPQFLLGYFSFTGWWYYYFVALALKTPLGGLFLFIISLCLFFWLMLQLGKMKAKQRKLIFYATSFLLFAGLLLLAAAMGKLNLGVRYILPIYPFIYLFSTLLVFYAFKYHLWHIRTSLLVGLLILWHGVSSVSAYPNYLSYFNEVIGSQKNADQYLIDSNLDWGQDLRRLAIWVQENNVEKIRVDYFGGGDVGYYLGDKALSWQSTYPREEGLYAVSRHFFRTSTYYENNVDYEEYFKDGEYLTTIGDSIYIYEIK